MIVSTALVVACSGMLRTAMVGYGMSERVWLLGLCDRPSARLLSALQGRCCTRAIPGLERNSGRYSQAVDLDVHVVLHAREAQHVVVTSDPDDLHRIDPNLTLVVV